MRTCRQEGFLLEQGPFNVLVRDPAFEELLSELGDDIEVRQASADAKIRYLYLNNQLVPLPMNPITLVTGGFLSARGKLRVLAEPICARKSKSDDPTIADFAARHFGEEFAQNIVGAMVTGIFAGDINQLSLKACFPSIAELDQNHRSLVLYGLSIPFRRIGKRKKTRRKWKGLVSVSGGLGALSAAIGRRLGDAVSTDSQVTGIARCSAGYAIDYTKPNETHRLSANRLILATAARQSAALISGLGCQVSGELVGLLESIKSVPLVVLNLGFREEDVGHDLKGFGFLVPPREQTISSLGVLWASSIFSGHAPAGHHLLRVFVGGSRRPELTEKSDSELVSLVLSELKGLLQIKGRPTLVNTCRYAAAIPQYCRGHTEMVRSITELLGRAPGLHLVGNYLGGVSINDCVRFAKATVHQIMGVPQN